MTERIDEPDGSFTTPRERWLWFGALLVVGAIALTLFIGPELAGLAVHRDVLAAAFLLAMLLVAATVVALAVGTRPRGLELGLALAVTSVLVLLLVRADPAPIERSHLIEYAALAALVHAALVERSTHGRRVPQPALLAIAITVTIGVVDECLQLFMPGRVFDPVDIVFNTTAAVGAVVAGVVLRRIARPRAHQPG